MFKIDFFQVPVSPGERMTPETVKAKYKDVLIHDTFVTRSENYDRPTREDSATQPLGCWKAEFRN